MKRFNWLSFLLLLVLSLGIPLDGFAKWKGYKILQKIPLEGDGGWDYLTVDSTARRLYLSHETMVQVLDTDTLKPIGTINGLDGTHGIALAPELNRGFITCGKSGTVVAFNLKTLKRVWEIPTGKNPDAILYDSDTGRVFSFNHRGNNVTVIDASTGKLIKTLDLKGTPEFVAEDGRGNVFNNLEDKNMIVKINTSTLGVLCHWSTFPGSSPSALAMDAGHDRLFIGCHNKVMVVLDSSNGRVIQTLPIGNGVDAASFDPTTGMVFCSCGDGTLTVIHEDKPNKFRVVESVATEPGARTLAVDSKTGHVFLDNADTVPLKKVDGGNPYRHKVVPGTFRVLVVGKK